MVGGPFHSHLLELSGIYFQKYPHTYILRLFSDYPSSQEHCKVGRWINKRLKCLSRQLLTASFLIFTLAHHLSTADHHGHPLFLQPHSPQVALSSFLIINLSTSSWPLPGSDEGVWTGVSSGDRSHFTQLTTDPPPSTPAYHFSSSQD